MPIPVAAPLLGLWVRIPPRAWMFISCELLCVRWTSLRRAYHSSRGVLLNVVRSGVWSRNRKNEEAIVRAGPQRHRMMMMMLIGRRKTSRSVHSNSYDHEHQHDGREQRTQDTACRSSGAELRVFQRESPDFVPRQSMWVDDTETGSRLIRTSVSRHQYHFNNAPHVRTHTHTHTHIYTYIHTLHTYVRTYVHSFIHSFIMRIKPSSAYDDMWIYYTIDVVSLLHVSATY